MNLKSLSLSILAGISMIAAGYSQPALNSLVDKELPSLVETYKMLHATPELSGREENTSAFLAKELRSLGYEVTDHVGKYSQPGMTGYGVVAVLKNGPGPVLLIRTDMDALPVVEKTGLPYASKVTTKDGSGLLVGVMHACGHDVHMTNLLGTARMMMALKSQWSGTLVLIAQPAEEIGMGARAMLNDGLYTRFPKPDFAIALHDFPFEAGKVSVTPAYVMASATSAVITVKGIGGHGSKPEATKDPVVLAAQIVLALQTIVSREVSPLDPAVVTVGSIHGGTRGNIIPDEVKLQLTIRTYKEEVRQKILASIERIVKNSALAAGVPPELAPTVDYSSMFLPATYNDPALSQRLTAVFKKVLGSDNVLKNPPVMGSEDFGLYGLDDHSIPTCMFQLGADDPKKVEQSKADGTELPGLHSPLFAPVPGPTLRTGIIAMTSAALDILGKK